MAAIMLSILPLQMQAESANIQSRNQAENESRIQDLSKQVADYQDQIARSQAEVIILFEVLQVFHCPFRLNDDETAYSENYLLKKS